MPTLSIIVGAGFSAPAGYPTAGELNRRLLNINRRSLHFSESGRVSRIHGELPASASAEVDLCIDLMHHYASRKGDFYYKDFYDYLQNDVYRDDEIKYAVDTKIYDEESIVYALGSMKYVFNRLIDICNTDSEGHSRYDGRESVENSLFEPYERFFGQLVGFDRIHIHSLNDDLLTDGIRYLKSVNGDFSDGFEFVEPSYKGEVWEDYGEPREKIELPQYTGRYAKRVNLYKLRGGSDYYALYKPMDFESFCGKEKFVKVPRSIDRISCRGVYLPFNYRGEFLSGMSVSSIRANYPIYYGLVFDKFRKNLEKSDVLIIIGYGCKDEDVNRMILNHFDSSRKCIIIDSAPGEKVQELGRAVGAEMVVRPFEQCSYLF